MAICTSAWRAAIGLWHIHQSTHPLSSHSSSKSFYQFHRFLPRPRHILLIFLLFTLLLACGDVHPNPGPTNKTPPPLKPITFCHLNTRSLPTVNDLGPRLHHIEQELTIDNHYDIIAMTETHLSAQIPDSEITINNYQLFRKDRNRNGGGVCIYVHDSLPVTRLTNLDNDNIETLWLKFHLNNQTIYFGTCYRPPGQTDNEKTEFLDILETHLEQILSSCRTSNHTLILTGDFNDRTTNWHSTHPDSEIGTNLYDLLNSYYLSQLINEPTRNNNILDLLITNNPGLIIDSGTLDPLHDLDHLPIYGKLNFHIKHNKPSIRNIWDFANGNYQELNDQLLQIPWGMVIGESDIDDAVEMMTALIKQCSNNCIPNKTVKIFPTDKPGMTSKVKDLLKSTRRLQKRAQRTNNILDIEKHQEKRREAKLAWQKAQDDHYKNIERKLQNSENNSRTYWKIIKSVICNRKNEAIPCIVDGDSIASSNTEKAEILNSFFAAQSTMPPAPPDHELPPFRYLTNDPISYIQTSQEEVYKILTRLNTNKACGPDLISNKILKECAMSLSQPLADLFNKSFNQGEFPQPWKHANVTPVYKKGDRQSKTNYRPISLLSNMSKVMERIVFNRLFEHCTKHNLLTEKNSGFKPFDSTINRLIHLTHQIYNALDAKQDTLIVFLDISKAFDRVWHPGLLHKLREFGITGNLYSWLESYLTGRSQKVVIGGEESSTSKTNAGVPQGSILGPLLFLIFINDIVQVVENPIYLFADDASLIKIFNNIQEATMSINRDLEHLAQWAHIWRVTFNAIKTVFMIISLKLLNHQPNPVLLLNNTPLKQVQQECYLGMVLTSNMSWKEHIHKLTTKASKKIGLLYTMKNKLSRSSKSQYYISFIRPVLEYGGVVFDNCTAFESNSLERVQRRAAILCTGAFRRTPTNLLLTEAGWDTLANRRKIAKKILMYKILNGITPNYLRRLIPPQVQHTTTYALRNRTHYRLPRTRTQISHTSFIPATLREWNTLDPALHNCRTLATFKTNLKSTCFKPHPLIKLYSFSPGPCHKYHTQLRLGLSKLNGHLFKYNIISDPSCPNCPNHTNETTVHYFMECPTYAAHREELFRGLRELLPQTTINNKKKCISALLGGIQDALMENNIKLFTIVQEFISETNRFA